MEVLTIFPQRNASFITQGHIAVYRYMYRTTGEGPEDLENKFERQRYTGGSTGLPVKVQCVSKQRKQSTGLPVKPTGLPVDCQVPHITEPLHFKMLYFPPKTSVFLSKNGKPFLSSPNRLLTSHLLLDSSKVTHNLLSFTSIYVICTVHLLHLLLYIIISP